MEFFSAKGYTNPLLQALQNSGLQYVLAENDAPPELSLLQSRKVAVPAAKKMAASPPFAPQAPPRAPNAPNVANTAPPLRKSPQHEYPAAAPHSAPDPASKPRPVVKAQTPDPSQWPLIWQKRFEATAMTPVIWTYAALKDDLGGTPSSARRDFFKRLFKDLGHPPGTHSFWPFVLRSGDADEERPDIFWQALNLRRTRALVIVDSLALTALGLPEGLQPLRFLRHNSVHVLMAGDIDSLLTEDNRRYEALSVFLRHNLRPYSR